MTTWHNWCNLETAAPLREVSPRSVDEIADVVTRAGERKQRVKMIGTGHSFTAISAPVDVMVRPDHLRGVLEIDRGAGTAMALAGTRLEDFNLALAEHDLSLHNMGDIAEQTLAGAISTGTHGTGGDAASLAAQVAGLEIVVGDGSVIWADDNVNTDIFTAARIGLGALGIITKVKFRVEPMFTIEAHEGPMSWDDAMSSFDSLIDANDYADMYWFPHTDAMHVKRNNRSTSAPRPPSRIGAWVEDELLSNKVFGLMNRIGHAKPRLVPKMAQIAGGALSERRYSDIAHRVFTTPRRVRFREMEYAVPRSVGVEALREARSLIERRGWNISFPVEIRVTPSDDIPLSTSYGRESTYLAFHVYERSDHREYFGEVEKLLMEYDGRPHWGKIHTRTASDLAPTYPRWDEFIALRDRLDPKRTFTNPYLDRVLGR